MVGPERGRYATKVERMLADAQWAEDAGLASLWVPQIPDDFDALTAAALIGTRTTRIEIGTAVVPIQPRHPIALAHQVLSTQAVCGGRLTLGLGVSHHWVIDEMLGLPYEHPAATMRAYLDVLDRALAGPGMVDVENDLFRIHNPMDITDLAPDLGDDRRPGPGDAAARRERADGTILWLADERAIESHVAPTINAAAAGGRRPAAAHRGRRAGLPVPGRRGGGGGEPGQPGAVRVGGLAQLPEAARPRRRPHGRGHPRRRQRGVDQKRLQAFADAGATDVSLRVVPIGDTREEKLASSRRTREYIASMAGSI